MNTTESTEAFALGFMQIPQPNPAPGTRWTIMTDLAMPLVYQESFLETVADILTRVKYAEHVSLVGRLPASFFQRKNALYHRFGLRTFTGGVPFEIAHLQNKVQAYFEALSELGFAGVEISTDCIADLTRQGRDTLIASARNCGLEVYTELGNKIGELKLDVDAAADCILGDLSRGVAKVAIENESLCYCLRNNALDAVVRIVDRVGLSAVAFEVGPGSWPDLAIWLLKEFGPDINVENLQYDRVLQFEAMRRGLHRSIGYTFFEGAGKT